MSATADVPRRVLTRRTLLAAAVGMAAVGATSACSGHSPLPRSDEFGFEDSDPAEFKWGAFIPSVTPQAGSSSDPIEQLAALAGAPPSYLHRFVALGDSLPVAELDAIRAAGAIPLLTLEPWRPERGINQPEFSLARIANGDFDDELRRWGREIARWNKPVLLRFAQEMNGTWYPWAIGINGNTPADYRDAWRRMHSVVVDAGARNVRFVWSPNVITEGTQDFVDCYPGDDTVDVLGLDGYNWGEITGHHWQSAGKLFDESLRRIAELNPDRRILITEVASADGNRPEDKAQWIREFFAIVESSRAVEGFVWFQMDKERDWRFNSTTVSATTFRDELRRVAAG